MKYSLFLGTILTSLLLAGCRPAPVNPVETPVSEVKSLTELTGTFTTTDPTGSKGILKTNTGNVAVESLILDLTQLNNSEVTLVGKYSGDTLFVSEVK